MASGARAVQITRGPPCGRDQAYWFRADEAQLAVLLELARQRFHEGKEPLELPATGAALGVEQSRSPGVAAGLPPTGRQRGRHRDGRGPVATVAGQRPRIALS
jgi:hypothetical protein